MDQSPLLLSSGEEEGDDHHPETELSFDKRIQHLKEDERIKSKSAKKSTDQLHLSTRHGNINVSYSNPASATSEKTEDPEVESVKNCIPLRTMLKAHKVDTGAYRRFMCNEATLDLAKNEGKELSSREQDWMNLSFNPKSGIPERKSYDEAMWTYMVTANARLYEQATVPFNQNTTQPTFKRFPRIPLKKEDVEAWENEVNKVLRKDRQGNKSEKETSILPQLFNRDYQFVEKQFQDLVSTPTVDTFVADYALEMGQDVPKVDNKELLFRTLETTKAQFRVLTFIRAATETLKLHIDPEKPQHELPSMGLVLLDRASEDLRQLTARLNGACLLKLRRKVLEKSKLSNADKDVLCHSPVTPANYLFAARTPLTSTRSTVGQQRKDARLVADRTFRNRTTQKSQDNQYSRNRNRGKKGKGEQQTDKKDGGSQTKSDAYNSYNKNAGKGRKNFYKGQDGKKGVGRGKGRGKENSTGGSSK